MNISNLDCITSMIEDASSSYIEEGALLDETTENDQPAFSTTGNVFVDLFVMSVRNASMNIIIPLFKESFLKDKVTSIALLLHLRDARNGKGEKDLSYAILLWLRKFYPQYYIYNLEEMINMGYYKDLTKLASLVYIKKLPYMFNENGRVQILEIRILAELLSRDIDLLNEKDSRLTLVAKWVPSENTFFDQKENGRLAYRIAKELAIIRGYNDKEKNSILRKYRNYVSALRKRIKIVETKMSQHDWDLIEYGEVPSKAHLRYKDAFLRHSRDRYEEYLNNVISGKSKVHTQTLQPHEIVSKVMKSKSPNETLEVMWCDMLDKYYDPENLPFEDTLAIVDVSGSMRGIPLEVSIALGLFVSTLTTGKWKKKCITFSSKPQLFTIKGNDLFSNVSSLSNMDWGANTDLIKVFKLLLKKYDQGYTPLKTLFIFTDMQFDNACGIKPKSTHKIISELFEENNYSVPNIIFWNLRGSCSSFPTMIEYKKVALLSGFSPTLLKEFMKDPENIDIQNLIDKILDPYKKLVKIPNSL